ncbi:MAG TPA: YqiA/YcfP family alpha/beta fold hydrolase [Moraxellaceae bacterium]
MSSILYIHGFLSSPQSAKAQQMLAWARQQPGLQLMVPALPVDPAQALRILEDCIATSHQPPGLIGSSLGGFYANILAARHGLRAVLINPAVHPHRLLAAYVGEQRNYHTGVAAEVKPEHFQLLETLEQKPPHPERLWVLLETGDEALDYRQAEQFYAACKTHVTAGGSHTYEGFAQQLPAIVEFLSQQ